MSKIEGEKEEVVNLYNVINGDKSRILSMCSGLENAIEILISRYFSVNSKDYSDLIGIIFANDAELSFSKKIKMFERFLKKIFPDYLKTNPDFIQKLNRVRRMRNKFAHSINLTLDEIEPFVGKTFFKLGFIEDGVPKEEEFSHQDILDRTKEVDDLMEEIKKLSNLVEVEANLKFHTFDSNFTQP